MIIDRHEFNKYLLEVIEETSYNFKIVNVNMKKDCSCLSKTTNEPDPTCPKCLGTGHKIVIRDGRGNSQDTPLPNNLRGSIYMKAKNYFIPIQYKIKKNDLIVDDNQVYLVYETQETRGINGTMPFVKANVLEKRFDKEIFLKNFNSIINGK